MDWGKFIGDAFIRNAGRNAAKNVTDSMLNARDDIESVATGVGGVAGAATGMAVGAIFGPLGMAVGAVVGAKVGSESLQVGAQGCRDFINSVADSKETGVHGHYSKAIWADNWFIVSDNCCDGLICVCKNKKWGYVNTKGIVVIEPQFGWAKDFSNGLAVVRQASYTNPKLGYINKSGRLIIDYQFTDADNFIGSKAFVKTSTSPNGFYIDRNGNRVN